ncbi:MAG TPA: diacylglycerol kinase family lipid kinase [Bacteroidales bacterium]|nr:diacylglycerol kinase family lipid kinase [Bacteroidales bacterium]
MKKTRFIVNPIAGKIHKDHFPAMIKQNLPDDSFESDIVFTSGVGHATALAEEAVQLGYDYVVAVGGDGTINEVSRCLIGQQTTLGIIPSGSGNGLARHLRIPIHPERALQLLVNGHTSRIDTGIINGTEVFVSLAGVGFDALVAKLFAKDPHRGFLGYFRIVAQRYPSYKPKHYSLTIDGSRTIETDALFITIANSNQFGYNTTIAPDAKLNDGLMDVCIVHKPPLFEMPVILNLLFLNMIHLSKHVEIIKASKVSIERKKNRKVNVDGEPKTITRNLLFEIVPSSLNVVIPKLQTDEEAKAFKLPYRLLHQSGLLEVIAGNRTHRDTTG